MVASIQWGAVVILTRVTTERRAIPQATFEAWQRRPSALTGWFPRGVAPQRGCRGYDYLSRDRSVLLRGAYSMVLTKVRLCTLAMLSPC